MAILMMVLFFNLLILILIVGLGFFIWNKNKSKQAEQNITKIIESIHASKEKNKNRISKFIEEKFEYKDDALDKKVNSIIEKETECYKQIIEVYLSKDSSGLDDLYSKLQMLSEEYCDLGSDKSESEEKPDKTSEVTDTPTEQQDLETDEKKDLQNEKKENKDKDEDKDEDDFRL